MNVLPDDEIERALVVTAHPDDVDFGAGGTVAAWAKAGIAVTYCVITDGQAGGFDPGLDRSEMPRIRRAEQTEAARELGVEDLVLLGYVDGELVVSRDLVRDHEGLEAWSPREVWLMEHPSSNHAVDVTDHFDAKLAALLCHESQHPDQSWIERAMRDELAATAVEYSLGEGRLGEKFAVYPLP